MKSELKFKLFGYIKEQFELATDLENYSYGIEFEIDDGYTTDDEIELDVTIKDFCSETIIRLSVDIKENLKINTYEDNWEEWACYKPANLWRQIFFNKNNVLT